jgi:hypothetical protein
LLGLVAYSLPPFLHIYNPSSDESKAEKINIICIIPEGFAGPMDSALVSCGQAIKL